MRGGGVTRVRGMHAVPSENTTVGVEAVVLHVILQILLTHVYNWDLQIGGELYL